jgi:hypothetical protein
MSDFKEQFSLGYLGGSQSIRPSSFSKSVEAPLPAGIEDVLASYSEKFVSVFKTAPDKTMKLFDLAQTTSNRLEVVLPIVQYLSGKGILERVNEDPVGNDTYRLNPSVA